MSGLDSGIIALAVLSRLYSRTWQKKFFPGDFLFSGEIGRKVGSSSSSRQHAVKISSNMNGVGCAKPLKSEGGRKKERKGEGTRVEPSA